MCAKQPHEHRTNFGAWKYIDRYDVGEYRCGLRAGDYVRLRRALVIRDWQGNPTGEVHAAGEIWRVLPGAAEDPVVFLLQPNGKRHTWDDDESIYEWFERVESARANSNYGTPAQPVD